VHPEVKSFQDICTASRHAELMNIEQPNTLLYLRRL
jgi:hypothetical protein